MKGNQDMRARYVGIVSSLLIGVGLVAPAFAQTGDGGMLQSLINSSPAIAGLVLVIYYLIREHLPAQQKTFSETLANQQRAFGEAILANAKQVETFITYMRDTRAAESAATIAVFEKLIAHSERTTEEIAREVKGLGSGFTRLRSVIHQHHDLVRARADEAADAELDEEREEFISGRARS